MKKIKFRIWDKELKKMFYTHQENFDNGFAFLIDGHFDDESPVLMQYTGLKDIDGEEVYEGDIVDCTLNDGIMRSELVIVCDIRSMPEVLYGDSLISRQIIGNIYEHQHLLIV